MKEIKDFKKRLYRIVTFIFFVSMFFYVGKVYANDGVLGITPSGVYPMNQTDITMKAEEIYITMDGKVTCEFVFKNYGKAQTVMMGFPASLDEYVDENTLTKEENITVRNFTARDNKSEIPVTLIQATQEPLLNKIGWNEKYSKWYCFSVDFSENEEKTLYHTYDVSFAYDSIGYVRTGYVIETGSLWKGSIGHSKITFDMGSVPIYSITNIYPNNYYRFEGNKLIWERRDYKPEYNLFIEYNRRNYTDWWLEECDNYVTDNEIMKKETDAAKEKIKLFNTPHDVIRENSSEYMELYDPIILSDSVSALYIKSALGLANGDTKPKIVELTIVDKETEYWYYELNVVDVDCDIVGHEFEIIKLNGDSYKGEPSNAYYDKTKKCYIFRMYFKIPIDETFAVTATVYDAMGNSDSKTLLCQNEFNKEEKEVKDTTLIDNTNTNKPEAVEAIAQDKNSSSGLTVSNITVIDSNEDANDDANIIEDKSWIYFFAITSGLLLILISIMILIKRNKLYKK